MILLVGDHQTDSLDTSLETLRRADVVTATASDVFEAMAMLTRLDGIRYAIVDLRSIDRAEAAFLNLAPRYFPSVELVIPLVPGIEERLRALGIAKQPTDLDRFFSEFAKAQPAPAAEQKAVDASEYPVGRVFETNDKSVILDALEAPTIEVPDAEYRSSEPDSLAEPPAPAIRQSEELAPLSASESPATDASQLHGAASEPSLHEAVRLRMTANDPRIIRRKPPAGHGQRPPDSTQHSVDTAVSPDEIEALLSSEAPARKRPDDGEDGEDASR